jgi:hypothetical protein
MVQRRWLYVYLSHDDVTLRLGLSYWALCVKKMMCFKLK